MIISIYTQWRGKSPAHPHIHLHVMEIKEDSIASICVCMGLVCSMCNTHSVPV